MNVCNVTMSKSNRYQVAAWNFFLPVKAGETAQLYWSATDPAFLITAVPQASPYPVPGDDNIAPGIPSVILTVNQVG